MKRRTRAGVLTWAAVLVIKAAGAAESAGTADADALAKALSNPVASLISVPFQLNYDTGYAAGGDRWTLNIQPVVPVSISEEWNVISRTILPLIDQHDVVDNGSQTGLGDTLQSLFFSPKKPTASGWIWGVGPAIMLPTATDNLLGSEKWSIGPTAVVLKQTGSGWTYGALMNHLWSVAGNDNRGNIDATFLQPFLAKGLGKGRTVTANFEASYDWESDQLTLPLNLMYSRVAKIGEQMVSFAGGARAYLDAPEGGPDWGLRFVVTLLFPK